MSIVAIHIACPCASLVMGRMAVDAGRLILACIDCRTTYTIETGKLDMPPAPSKPPWQCTDCGVTIAGSDVYCWNCDDA